MGVVSFSSIFRAGTTLMGMSARATLVASGYQYFPSELQDRIKDILAGQQLRVWSTKGGEIGANWGRYTLIDTGDLRASMINPSRLIVRGYGTTFEVESDVEYARFVNERWGRIYGLSAQTVERLETLIKTYILRGEVL